MRQNGDDHLGLVLEALDEQRADRTVDQARDQGLLFGGTALALEEATGDLTGGKGLFLIIHGQREEVDPGFWRTGGDDGRQNHGLAVGGQHSAVSLTRDTAGLEGQRAAGPVDGFTFNVEHVCLSVSPPGPFLTGDAGRAGSDHSLTRHCRPWSRLPPAPYRTHAIGARRKAVLAVP